MRIRGNVIQATKKDRSQELLGKERARKSVSQQWEITHQYPRDSQDSEQDTDGIGDASVETYANDTLDECWKVGCDESEQDSLQYFQRVIKKGKDLLISNWRTTTQPRNYLERRETPRHWASYDIGTWGRTKRIWQLSAWGKRVATRMRDRQAICGFDRRRGLAQRSYRTEGHQQKEEGW